MNLFEKNFRTIRARETTLTPAEMENFRIKRIFNSFGDRETLDEEEAKNMLDYHISSGESCLLMTLNKGNVFTISIVIFEDDWSRNLFAMKFEDSVFSLNDFLSICN